MAQLDRNKPFEQVWGDHPFQYQQAGRYFLGNGHECDKSGRPLNGHDAAPPRDEEEDDGAPRREPDEPDELPDGDAPPPMQVEQPVTWTGTVQHSLTPQRMFFGIAREKLTQTDTRLLKDEYRRLTGRDPKLMGRDKLLTAIRTIYRRVIVAVTNLPVAQIDQVKDADIGIEVLPATATKSTDEDGDAGGIDLNL